MKDRKLLPQLKDRISFLYLEYAAIGIQHGAVVYTRKMMQAVIPCANLLALFLGPGTTITQAAVTTLTAMGCTLCWCSDGGLRSYAAGIGVASSSHNLLCQAGYCMDAVRHMDIVRRMYAMRFPDMDCKRLSLRQLRGREGVRVRKAYLEASKESGIPWVSREYKIKDMAANDEINQALTIANWLLYGICEAAVLALGFSPALGFIHTGKALSFIYDIADLYKAETSIPAAFQAVSLGEGTLSQRVRRVFRNRLYQQKVLKRIPKDLGILFHVPNAEKIDVSVLWDGWHQTVPGGVNYADEET